MFKCFDLILIPCPLGMKMVKKGYTNIHVKSGVNFLKYVYMNVEISATMIAWDTKAFTKLAAFAYYKYQLPLPPLKINDHLRVLFTIFVSQLTA